VSDLEAACRKGGVSLHGTGIHPGGITERFPLMISALSREITHVRAEEFSDIRSYDAPAVVGDVMLFGKTPEEAAASPMLRVLGAGFAQSIDMVADALGFDLDREHRTTHEVAVATAPIDSPIGPIAPGRVAAQRFTWEGTVRGEPVIDGGGYESDEDFAFRMITYRTKEVYCTQGQNLPSLRAKRPYNPVLMNPVAMCERGLEDGDAVWVENEHGRVQGFVEASEDVDVGTIAFAFGWGDPADPRTAREKGSNVQALTCADRGYDAVTGLALQSAIPVNVRPSS